MSECQNDYYHGDHKPCKDYVCPNHGELLNCEIDEGGACLVCEEFFLVVPPQELRDEIEK